MNLDPSHEAVIVAAARTAIGKAKRGSLASFRPDEMAVAVIKDLLRRAAGLDPAEIEDVILGCAFPEGEQGMNMARMVTLQAGLPVGVPAETVNRFCASGLQSIAHAAMAIQSGHCRRRRIDEHGAHDGLQVLADAADGRELPAGVHQYGPDG
jgi:acetyl-CoA acyltransferase